MSLSASVAPSSAVSPSSGILATTLQDEFHRLVHDHIARRLPPPRSRSRVPLGEADCERSPHRRLLRRLVEAFHYQVRRDAPPTLHGPDNLHHVAPAAVSSNRTPRAMRREPMYPLHTTPPHTFAPSRTTTGRTRSMHSCLSTPPPSRPHAPRFLLPIPPRSPCPPRTANHDTHPNAVPSPPHTLDTALLPFLVRHPVPPAAPAYILPSFAIARNAFFAPTHATTIGCGVSASMHDTCALAYEAHHRRAQQLRAAHRPLVAPSRYPSLHPTTFTTLPHRAAPPASAARTLAAHHPGATSLTLPLVSTILTARTLLLDCAYRPPSPATLPDLIKREDAAAGGQCAQGSLTRCARDMESACTLNASRIGVRLVSPRELPPTCPPPPSSRARDSQYSYLDASCLRRPSITSYFPSFVTC
ncbi:hypothetical protein B0H13DRAFT_2683862 [Mycena leptocephala]|nr:hypothetical protein B0H13DRAFT_2683862 [Mycena leptocephala]